MYQDTFWDTVRGVRLAESLTTFIASNPDIGKEIHVMNENLETLNKYLEKICDAKESAG